MNGKLSHTTIIANILLLSTTYFTSNNNVRTPETSGVEALVPTNSPVQSFFTVVVVYIIINMYN